MAKDAVKKIKLQIEAGKATPAPPVGTVLGPAGINLQDFCTKYNEATTKREAPLQNMPIVLGHSSVIHELIEEKSLHPLQTLTDKGNQVLDAATNADSVQRSQQLTQEAIRTYTRNKNLIHNAVKNLTSQGTKIILHHNVENERETLQKSAGKSADEIMGL